MSVPQDQMLAMYRQHFPQSQFRSTGQPAPTVGDGAMGFSGTQPSMGVPGMSKSAGNAQAASQLITALMKAQKQKQLQQQLDQQRVNQNMPSVADQNAATAAMTNSMLQQQPLDLNTPGGL